MIHAVAIRIIRRLTDPVARTRYRRGCGSPGAGVIGSAVSSAGTPRPNGRGSRDRLNPRMRSRGPGRLLEAVAQPADGGDHVGTQLLADARDEHFDRIRIAIE